MDVLLAKHMCVVSMHFEDKIVIDDSIDTLHKCVKDGNKLSVNTPFQQSPDGHYYRLYYPSLADLIDDPEHVGGYMMMATPLCYEKWVKSKVATSASRR